MSLSRRGSSGPARRAPKSVAVLVESLDGGVLLSTFTVTNLADAGAGSLRALLDANSTAGADVINFSVAGTIPLAGALPAVTGPVVIDGTTAPGFTRSPVVQVDFGGANGLAFDAGSAGSTLRSLSLIDAGSDAVTLNDSRNLLTGNFLGVATDGATVGSNRGFGLTINATSTANTIGASTAANSTGSTPLASNLISGNRDGGIAVHGSTGNLFVSNYIGTNLAGSAALPNGGDGLRLDSGANNNTIGGTVPFKGPPAGQVALSNLISGNRGTGIFLAGSSSNFLAANLVGTDFTGIAAVPNDGDGIALTAGSNGNNLQGTVDGQSPFVYANIVGGNRGNGLRIASSNSTTVQANFFGLGLDNKTAVGNGGDGALVEGTSRGVVFGGNIPLGNVTSANGRNGVEIRDTAGGFTAFNSFCGTDAFSQLNTLGNKLDGFLVTSTGGGNLIRTSVISANGLNGVEISGSATGVQVAEDEIGVSTNGQVALPNGANGVLVAGNATGNTIGGKLSNFSIIPHNVISGNTGHGVAIAGSAKGTLVSYGFIGTDVGGVAPLPNGGSGVFVGPGTSNTTIGGTAADTSNVIGGNLGNGIQLLGTTGNQILGNRIGLATSGPAPLGNGGSGILIADSSKNSIGGSASGAGNTIGFNGAAGVLVQSGSNNAMAGNSIFNNGSRGIVLVPGANNNQAAPSLTSVARNGRRTTLQGRLRGTANATYHVAFFADARPGVTTASSGQTPIGSVDVTTNGGGSGRFRFALASLPRRTFFTATATSAAGDSSEFSDALPK